MSHFRVLITGDRHWHDLNLALNVVNRLLIRYRRGLVIVHGAATGVDSAFAAACEKLNVVAEPHPADWGNIEREGAVVRRRRDGTLYDANAGPVRNREMVEAGASLCLAVHRDIGKSRGTRDCARRAIAAGIPTWLIDNKEGIPRRLEAI